MFCSTALTENKQVNGSSLELRLFRYARIIKSMLGNHAQRSPWVQHNNLSVAVRIQWLLFVAHVRGTGTSD